MSEKISKATIQGDVYKDYNPENEDVLYFRLQDNVHEFIIGLSDILACLKFAEEEGEIPKIPPLWWSEVSALYPKVENLVDVPEE